MKTAKPMRYDEIEGKVVSGAGFGFSRMLIAFTDGSVLALTVDEGCDGPEMDFEQGRDIDLLSSQWVNQAHEAGIVTREEMLKSHKAQDARRIARLTEEIESLKKSQ